MQPFFPNLGVYFIQLPIFIAWLVGIMLAIINWRRYPRASLLTSLSLILFIFLALVSPVINDRLPILLRAWFGFPFRQEAVISVFIGFIESIVRAIAWLLLFVAMFSWRSSTEKEKAPLGGYRDGYT
jgi:uncharacterized membrane protein